MALTPIQSFFEEIPFRLKGKRHGDYKSLVQGEGIEKSDIRKYSAGYPAKRINRKASAKHNKMYSNIPEQTANANAHVFFDCNRNWIGGSKEPTHKNIRSSYHTIQKLCEKHNINLTVSFPSTNYDKIQSYVCKKNRQQLQIAEEKLQNTLSTVPKQYCSLLKSFLEKERNKTGQIVIIFSDFLEYNEETHKLLVTLSFKNYLLLGQIAQSTHGEIYEPFFTNQAKVHFPQKITHYNFTL